MKAKKNTNYISIENEFPEERLSLPKVIGNKSIPSPFTKFGKSLDGILRNGGFHVNKAEFGYYGIDGELIRHYNLDKSGVKISYEHAVLLTPCENFLLEKLETMPEGSINISKKGNVKFNPILFYDLYSKEELSSEKINISTDNSWLEINNNEGTEFERQQLVYGEDKDLHSSIKKMFNIKGMIKYSDKGYFFPQSQGNNENLVDDRNWINEMYIGKDAVLSYISNVVSNLSKAKNN